ncbi:hypothetical protein A2V82_12705 [candidate division KSB1 bacterium RBG_16_48_16]|nr:MAG: hypothetical protein A2V82_12705 [candidate division KSB1 bacterium RBG_16_48_16]
MATYSYKILSNKVLIYANSKMCYTSEELIESEIFKKFLQKAIKNLSAKNSPLLDIFADSQNVQKEDLKLLCQVLSYLTKVAAQDVPKLVVASDMLFRDAELLNAFVEYLYNYWRHFERFILCSSAVHEMDEKPYRTFNATIEDFTHLVRKTYRDIQENITGKHPMIYRQVRAGAEIAVITSNKFSLNFGGVYGKLKNIQIIRQILLNPPLILNPPMNKRTGRFIRIEENPLERISIQENEWLCYPAKVGPLLIYIYFHEKFYELGFSLCNLFEMADNEDLAKKPDGIYTFGVAEGELDGLADFPTVFYEDKENDILVAAVPNNDDFGYFGYLKKMVLTLHNIKIMKRQELPFHGALVKISLHNQNEATVLLIGDTGAGKSETLEAFRILGDEKIKDMNIIADDMGSIRIAPDGHVLGYGTEIGAFVRLDDLQPGYAFGQIDRAIIMSPNQVNARVVLPVTTFASVVKGFPIHYILYANNYEMVDEDHPIVERFSSKEEALRVFREGTVMSKGTTTSTGLVHSYFANIFGPPQYKQEHEILADEYFEAFFQQGLFVGQIRTRLGISGWETKGPEMAARELLKMFEESQKIINSA